MPIDPSIALGYQPMKLENPIANTLAAQNVGVNALKMQEMQRGLAEENALRDLIKGGADINSPDTLRKMYEISPKQGIAFEKSRGELAKIKGESQKLMTENAQKATELYREQLPSVNNPQDMASFITAQYNDPRIGAHLNQVRPLEQAIAAIPQDPAGFNKYKNQMAMGMKDFITHTTVSANTAATVGATMRGQDMTYNAATQPIFNEAVGGFVTRPTAANPSSTVIPLTNPEATTKGQVVAKGKNLVADVATDMAASYGVLKELGGIKSKENSPQKNISAALQSSMVGQVGGSMLGTPEQDARDAIMSQRPILVQAIVKATGIAASQINSDRELKNLLDAATDPSKGYETNIKSLNKINKRFGLGGDIIELPTAPAKEKVSVGAPQKTNPNIDALLKKYE